MKLLISLLLLCFVIPAYAINCNAVVQDDANVLSASDQLIIQAEANKLINQGIDVRIIASGLNGYGNLDQLEKSWEKACTGWQAADGGRKNSLLVLAVAPRERKMGVYFGGVLRPALSEHWNRIKSDYMAPHFRDKDWTGGFVATLEQISRRVIASQNEAKTGGPTTINQAADYSGFWKFLMWLLIVSAGGVGIWFVLAVFRRRKKEREEIQDAQQEAISMRNVAATYLNKARSVLTEQKAAGEKVAFKVTQLDSVQEELARLNDSLSTDPTQHGLSVEAYNRIRDQYNSIYDDARRAMTYEPSVSTAETKPTMPDAAKILATAAIRHKMKKRSKKEVAKAYAQPVATPTPVTPALPPPAPSNYSSSNIVILNNQEERIEHDDDNNRSRSWGSGFSSDSDSDSGGSSTFGSSSSDDAGGSSDFGSSDSNSSGGGSDF